MNSPIPRVYVDSSVFGGIVDEEFSSDSRLFFEHVRDRRFTLLTSAVVMEELRQAPEGVRTLFEAILPDAEILAVDEPVRALQAAYLAEGIVTPKSSQDALHVALASVAQADLIVSWNFRHIVHFDKIRGYNAVNRLNGWRELAIHSPREVVTYEDEDV